MPLISSSLNSNRSIFTLLKMNYDETSWLFALMWSVSLSKDIVLIRTTTNSFTSQANPQKWFFARHAPNEKPFFAEGLFIWNKFYFF